MKKKKEKSEFLEKLPDFIAMWANWYFLFLMAFVLIIVGLNPAAFSFYVIPEGGEIGPTAIPPPGCNPPHGWNKSQWYDQREAAADYNLSYGSRYLDTYSINQEYWEQRCSMRWLSQEEADEISSFYIDRLTLAGLCMIILTLLNSRARKNLKKLYNKVKELMDEVDQ